MSIQLDRHDLQVNWFKFDDVERNALIVSIRMTLSSIHGNLRQKFTCLFDYIWTKQFILSIPMRL